ncbi:hypothetical protein KFL_008410050 [Klebsormidium nitens]|uniref:CCHC-type domain-containing protein n=1 Tax=Klebsormidium nitens TaxID=105231 RepID=A0A1Y1ILQ9_KLENI|nr:hypothetical protein KFL_008410050 [Klebsormidium nitens]|eukprot:GAQ91734.1 hypothetical protein KFL_008410050 [Klebsormidium nitens]
MARGKGNPSRLGARMGSRKGAGSAKAEDVVTGGRGLGGGTPEKGTGGAGGVSEERIQSQVRLGKVFSLGELLEQQPLQDATALERVGRQKVCDLRRADPAGVAPGVTVLRHGRRGAERLRTPGRPASLGRPEELVQRIRGLKPSEVENAQGFIDGWNRFKLRFPRGFPEDKLWVNFVANHPERAKLLGVTVNPRQHWPFVQLRCPSPCPLCHRPERDEQRIREAVERAEAEEREERARKQLSARQQQEERALREAEELRRRDELTAVHGRRFEQREEALETKKEFRKKEEKRLAEVQEQFAKDVERNPRLAELLEATQRFVARWGPYVDGHSGVPEAKLWLAYVANDPRGASGFGAKVSLAEHLPQVVNGCLTACRLCDQVQSLETRQQVWNQTQQLVEQAARAKELRERAVAAEAARVQAESAKKKRERKAEAKARRIAEQGTGSKEKEGEEARPAWLEEELRGYCEWHSVHGWLLALLDTRLADQGRESTEESGVGQEGRVEAGKEVQPVVRGEQAVGWWEDPFGEMATCAGADGKLRFSGKKGEGLTIKQFELMVKGSLLSRFKKLQKDVGEPITGPEFLGNYCIFLGEFLDNPAKLAHEREYEAHCRETDPVAALLKSLKRHFKDHKEGRAHEWVAFRREPGEELPSLLFRLQGLALDLEKPLEDKELVGKFVASLDRRFAEQTNTQAMSSTVETGGAYTLDEAYEAALMVAAGNACMKIARELVPRSSEVPRACWGGRASGAHSALQLEEPVYAAAVAAPVAQQGGSGACHNRGETGHYRNACPHPPQNSAGRGGGRAGRGGGGRGRGRGPCWVCGDHDHQAAQCAKHAAPAPQPQHAAVAVRAPPACGDGRGVLVSGAKLRAFQEWRASSQAALATRADEGEEEDFEWDEQEYALGAVALPVSEGTPNNMAAAGTRAGAEKAKATRAAKRGPREAGRQEAQVNKGAVGKVGTEQIARPMGDGTEEALRARRDKGAAKERAAKLPDHGRYVVPQGLHRLPAGFAVRDAQVPQAAGTTRVRAAGNARASSPDVVPKPTHPSSFETVQAPYHLPGKTAPAPFQNQGRGQSQTLQGLVAPGAGVLPQPVLTGGVHLDVGTFLELAQRADMSMADVVALTRGQKAGVAPPQAQVTAGSGNGRSLSPAALRAQEARERSAGAAQQSEGQTPGGAGAKEISGPMAQWVAILEDSVRRAPEPAGVAVGAPSGSMEGADDEGYADAVVWADVPVEEAPESSAMGEGRGRARQRGQSDKAMAEARQEEELRAHAEERSIKDRVSRQDAALARKLVTGEAMAKGIDPSAAVEAQAALGGERGEAEKGKEKEGDRGSRASLEEALGWEKRVAGGAKKGSTPLAPVTFQPHRATGHSKELEADAYAHAAIMACFADGRPLVEAGRRSQVEGVPDWVDNSKGAVRVAAPQGLVTPQRVLLDGGSYYTMVGARLKEQLGLGDADMDAGGQKVHTATGKVESLQGGLTKEPVPIILNANTPEELTICEKVAFTGSTGYDLLIGIRAAYPSGLLVDRWAETAVYRADWQRQGVVVGKLPMKLHQELGAAWTTDAGGAGPGSEEDTGDGPSSPTGGKEGGGTLRQERMRRWRGKRWPRGPVLDVAAEAERAVWQAVGEKRKKPGDPKQVPLPQLEGCRPINWNVAAPLPADRPLRILELFAGAGAATQAVARLGYSVGEVIACERRGAARQAHSRALQRLAKEFPNQVSQRAGAQLHHRLPQDVQLVTAAHPGAHRPGGRGLAMPARQVAGVVWTTPSQDCSSSSCESWVYCKGCTGNGDEASGTWLNTWQRGSTAGQRCGITTQLCGGC